MVGGDAGAAVAAFVDEAVVAAQQDEVVEVGGSSGGPVDDVVGLAPVRWAVTAGEPATAVSE
jgi:hypothetical protein